MNTLKKLTTLATVALVASVSEAQESPAVCAPSIIALRTDFPAHALAQRQHGEVRLALRLDSDGRVVATRVVQSSGHSALDREANASARRHWRFAVTHCPAEQLSLEYIVSVTYRRPPGLTLSGTVNRKSVARTRHLLADNRCQATKPGQDTLVFACLDATTLDNVAVRH